MVHLTNQSIRSVSKQSRTSYSSFSSLNPFSFFFSQVQTSPPPPPPHTTLLLPLLSIHFQFSPHKPKLSLSHTTSIFNFSSQVSGYHDYHWFWWFCRVHKMCSRKCYSEFSSILASPPGLMLLLFLFMSILINLIICFCIKNESFHWHNQRCRRFEGDMEVWCVYSWCVEHGQQQGNGHLIIEFYCYSLFFYMIYL